MFFSDFRIFENWPKYCQKTSKFGSGMHTFSCPTRYPLQKSSKNCEISVKGVFSKYLEVFFRIFEFLKIGQNIAKKHQTLAQEGVHFRVHSTNLYQKSSKLSEILVRGVFSKYLEVFFDQSINGIILPFFKK